MAVRDIGIYFPESSAQVFRYHFSQLAGRASDAWSYYITPDAFVNSQHQRRVACFQIPYPYDDSIEHLIDSVYNSVDAIVVLGSEIHSVTVDFIRRFDRPKMRWFLCGQLTPPLDNGRTYPFLDWFTTSVHFYKHVKPSILYNLRPYDTKPKMFDALLGRKKRHRDQAFDFIHSHQLENQCVTTYMNTRGVDFSDTTKWIWPDTDIGNCESVNWTVEQVNYHGYNMSLSQIIPIDVYNQTAYSLVCETNADSDYVFYTEKTVKPILSRRLFIMLGCRYTLAKLRDMGFKTFHGIINESYDEINNEVERHATALEQLKWLCNQPQERILAQCRDIVDHNFDLMYGRDWYSEFSNPLGRVIFD